MTSKRFIYSILAVFISGIFLLIFLQYNYSRNIDDLTSSNEKILYELQVNNQLRELDKDMITLESRIRGSVATDNISFLEGLDLGIAESKKHLDSILKNSAGDSTKIYISRIYQYADEKLALRARVIDSFRDRGKPLPEKFDAILESRMASNSGLNDLFRRLFINRETSLNILYQSISDSGKKAKKWGDVMLLLVLVSEAILFWYVINRIRRQSQLIHQLDTSEKKLRKVSVIKENFMANMSHEIRTPMNAILGFTNLINKKNKQTELVEFITSIRESGENLLAIINDILDLSKIEAHMMHIESRPFKIREVVHSLQILFSQKIDEKRLLFLTVIDDTVPDMISGDATRLRQILINLVSNAVKFTHAGQIRIEIKNKKTSGQEVILEFAVSDTGIGIAQEKLSHIFERFIQAEDSITRKYGGTGLGLAIVKQLVSLQNGKITVESTPGSGTTFTIVIPYQTAPDNIADIQSPTSLSFVSEIKDPFVSEHINILIIEDNKMNQSLLMHLFNNWGISFAVVNNGLEGINSLQTGKYDLILMDIQMPVMDGYTAAEEIRIKLQMDIPIIAMTAHALASERGKCFDHGMNGYIAKPIDEEELLKTILQFTGNVATQATPKKRLDQDHLPVYKFISLHYLYDISNGDKNYEKQVTGQFIEDIPGILESLESALKDSNVDTLRKTAHSMKTDVSIMGLSDKMQPFLDAIEFEPFDDKRFQEYVLSIKTICTNALPEARHFYSTL